MDKKSRIFVAGGDTLIGAAILRQLEHLGYTNIIEENDSTLDLTDAVQVADFFSTQAPEYIFLAAGKTGGIEANRKYPAELMLDNILVESYIIHNAYRYGVKKLLFLASSCCYPRNCPQPMQVESLLTGPLEPTNESYAVAKIAGIKLCQAYHQQYDANFIVGIPANSFGIGDDFSLENSHVIPAMLRKMHEAKTHYADRVEIWGTGTPKREFIFADDLAEACMFVMQNYNSNKPINLGSGKDISILELANLVGEVVGYKGQLYFDTSKPDGMPFKALDASKLHEMGWVTATPLIDAIAATYASFLHGPTDDKKV
jgi:GDP-L-fucose synthase